MEPKILEPSHALIKQYVESIYIFEKGEGSSRYIAYPSLHTAIGLFRNAGIVCNGPDVIIKASSKEGYQALAGNRLHDITSVHYVNIVDEIAINFKPLGFTLFTGSLPGKSNFFFHDWDADLKALFAEVFITEDETQKLRRIEQFLLDRYHPAHEATMLNTVISLLCDFSRDLSLQEIADEAGVHYKHLRRCFTKYVGSSAAHFRKIARFRDSLQAGLKQREFCTFTEICYTHNFTDQSYFIKQFRELTGENPRMFFRNIQSFSENYVVWKFI